MSTIVEKVIERLPKGYFDDLGGPTEVIPMLEGGDISFLVAGHYMGFLDQQDMVEVFELHPCGFKGNMKEMMAELAYVGKWRDEEEPDEENNEDYVSSLKVQEEILLEVLSVLSKNADNNQGERK